MKFRPCIDLRGGRVVQIVGGSLKDVESLEAKDEKEPITNFETEQSSATYAQRYKDDNLSGGHVISLGPGNHEAAIRALKIFPGGMQMGGGIRPDNAEIYLDAGASHVIVTSYVFREGQVDVGRLQELVSVVSKDRLVLDLSCRKREGEFWVVTNRWQKFTKVKIQPETLTWLADYCAEFLVHGVDVEGKQTGIETALVEILGRWSPIPVTYAGGAKSFADLDRVNNLGQGRVDLTIGSALDIFGGTIPYWDVVAWQKKANQR